MTPQERQLVTDLFDRLTRLEASPRDPDAERTIIEGLRRAPNAVYALVQTTLVQDEALKRADARIRALEGAGAEEPEQPAGFLDGMRDTLFGRRPPARSGSVPSVGAGMPAAPPDYRPGAGAAPAAPNPWQAAAPGAPAGPAPSHGGSFLGTAAAAAAGMIGGSLLFDGIRSMTGHGGAFGLSGPALGASGVTSPWWDANAASGTTPSPDAGGSVSGHLSGQASGEAGVDDIGRTADSSDHQGVYGSAGSDSDSDQDYASDQGDSDFGDSGFGGSDSDVA